MREIAGTRVRYGYRRIPHFARTLGLEAPFAQNNGVDEAYEADASESGWSLYPDGFSAQRFAEVIETEAGNCSWTDGSRFGPR